MTNYDAIMPDGSCIFCKIARKEIDPMGKGIIYEDDKYLAWLSPHPNTLGFTAVIPKKHFGSDCLAMPDDELKEFIVIAKKVAKILENYFEDVGRVGLIMEGTGIDHAHIKLSPMHGTEHFKKGEWRQYPSSVDTIYEKYNGYISSNDGPEADLGEIENLAEKIREKYENNIS